MPELPNQQLPAESPPPWSNLSKKSFEINWAQLTIVSSILIFIIILAVLAYWLFVLRPKLESQPPLPSPIKKEASPSAEPASPSAEKDETVSWEVYKSDIGGQIQKSGTNIKLKINYKYPSDFKLINEEGTDVLTNDQNYTLGLRTPGSVEVFTSVFTSVGGTGAFTEGTDTTLGGKTAKRLMKTTVKTTSYERIVITYSVENADGKGNNLVLFCAFLPKEGLSPEKTCDLIASTFRFD